LRDLGLPGSSKDIQPGPAITRFEFEPALGVKSAPLNAPAGELARAMGAASVRVSPLPGGHRIAIELPNGRRERVYLRELFDDDRWRSCDATLPLALGRDLTGTPLIGDLARMPHLLIAGSAGSGRSVGVNAMILSLIYRLSPDQCRLLLIDPKLEHCVWDGLPHLLCPVVGEAHKAVTALDWVVAEMERRYQQMARLGLRNIDVFNNRVRQAQKRAPPHGGGEGELGPLAHLVLIVGELGELMLRAADAVEAAVQRLAQPARAAGIHLIVATRRPSSDILTPAIKASIPARVCFKVASGLDSRSILNEQGAEQLLGQGDMLFLHGSGRTLRAQGCYVSDEEVEGVVRFLRNEGEPHYVEGITGSGEGAAHLPQPQGWEELYDHAVSIVVHEQKASTSYLQRRLSLGYNRAADLMERMQQEGIVSAPGRGGRRHILRCI
jgi:S-DNA-T family DNA segregation ATPase FtsK/SpoIIIE